MREQGIPLKNGIDGPFVRRQLIDAFAFKKDIAAVRCDEAADNPQRGCLPATGRAQQGDKLSIRDAEIQTAQHLFPIERHRNVFELDNIGVFHDNASPFAVIEFPEPA